MIYDRNLFCGCWGTLAENCHQQLIKVRVFTLKKIGTFEKVFGNYGKKLCLVGSTIGIDIGTVTKNLLYLSLHQV